MKGRIIQSLAGFYYIESNHRIYQTRARGNFRKKGQTPFVGDIVDFSADRQSEGYILSIEARKNSLIRPPIVNIDQAVIILSAQNPDFNSNLLDRFLILLEQKQIKPIIYISKLDLLNDLSEITIIRLNYEKIGYHVCFSIEELIPYLSHKITVFMGQTGVGKSTLLNKLLPNLNLETREISKSLGRGKHTTRSVKLFDAFEGKIADTPGFSSLDYGISSSEDLNKAFPELRELSHSCKFRTCTHTHEPNCAVKEALKRHNIWSVRYENYLQFLSEIENRREIYKKVTKRK